MGRDGFTLVELLIAVSLGVILIGVLVAVWTESSDIVTRQTNKLEITQRMRSVLDQLERDLANVHRTVETEFYVDQPGSPSPYYDPGQSPPEEYSQHYFETYVRDDETGAPVASTVVMTGGIRTATDTDHMPATFAPQTEGGDAALNGVDYIHGPLLYQPDPYECPERRCHCRDDTSLRHRRDEAYVRTFCLVNGQQQPAIVHYRLEIPPNAQSQARARPNLVRTLRYRRLSGGTPQVFVKRYEIAEGVTDLSFEIFYKPSRVSGAGTWLSPREALGFGAKPEDKIEGVSPIVSGVHAFEMVFEGTGIVERSYEYGVLFRDAGDPPFQFGGVRPGDRILLYEAVDDDNLTSSGGKPTAGTLTAAFGKRLLTVQSINSKFDDTEDQWHISIRFVEPLNLDGPIRRGIRFWDDASGTWAGEETDANLPYKTLQFPDRKVTDSFRVKYIVGWIPAAFRVKIRVRDFLTGHLLPFQRVVRILSS